jgi:hypothetical protein
LGPRRRPSAVRSRFQAIVKNVGTTTTPPGVVIGVAFAVDGTTVSWSDTYSQSLPPGQSVLLFANSGPSGSGTWTATSGNHTLQAGPTTSIA